MIRSRSLRGVLFAALSVAVPSVARAQCSAATQKLIVDLKYDEAKTIAEAAVKRTPNDDAALECLGRVYMSLDRAPEAEKQFEKAVKLNDKSSSHHLWLGNAIGEQAEKASKLKQPFMARKIKSEFERAVELDPSSVDARHGLIQFYTQAPSVMGGSKDKAKEQAREIAKINPVQGHIEMVNILAADKDSAGMEREYAAIIAAVPDTNVGYINLAALYQAQKKWAKSLEIIERWQKAVPADPYWHFYLGRQAALSGEQLDRGEKEMKFFLANPPKSVPVVTLAGGHFRLGTIYDRQGKKDLAKAEYQETLKLNPNHAEAKKALGK